MSSSARITIVGGGAMGALFAGLLARAGSHVTVLDASPAVVTAINAAGVTVTTSDESFTVPVRAATNPKEIDGVDAIFLFVKCYHTHAAIKFAAPLLASKPHVVSLQNGWGNGPLLAREANGSELVIGVTYVSSTVVEPGKVACRLGGQTFVGPYNRADPKPAQWVAQLIGDAGLDVTVADPVELEIWRKLVLNAATLPTSAISRLPAGRMYGHPEMRQVVDDAAREAVAVARASGYPLDEQECLDTIHRVLQTAGEVKSSMLQDVERGTRTEIDVVTGAIVRAAEAAEIDVPVNRVLYSLVNGYEAAAALA